MKTVYQSILPVTTLINHFGTLECQFQGKMTKNAIYLKSGIRNSNMLPIPTGPFLSFSPPHLPDKACSQAGYFAIILQLNFSEIFSIFRIRICLFSFENSRQNLKKTLNCRNSKLSDATRNVFHENHSLLMSTIWYQAKVCHFCSS